MRLAIDHTRFFAVVGAPYITERHADGDVPRRNQQCDLYENALVYQPRSMGSWLQDDR